MSKMNWNHLLSGKRRRESTSTSSNKTMKDYNTFRNPFDADYQRIIYSSSLRRLQDKAQVFPLQENDFIRTRLTHSLEVSSLGESLGWNIGYKLHENDELSGFWQIKELASLIKVSCLVHDLGNPPFGHYGEDIIRNWFTDWFKTDEFEFIEKEFVKKGYPKLTNQQKNDFQYFEGNAQTIRILSKLQFLNDEHGVNFTYGTLATLMKYPWNSDLAEDNKHKFGFFNSEEELIKEVMHNVGVKRNRHPATLILEAADDISYCTADIEDAVKKGVINWKEECNALEEWIKKHYIQDYQKLIKGKKKTKDNKVPNSELVNVQNFKITAQNIMFREVINVFMKNYDNIITGNYSSELLNDTKVYGLVELLKDLAVKFCFSNNEVLKLELAGDRAITDLLKLFIKELVTIEEIPKTKLKSEKLLHLISDNFRYIQSLDDSGDPTVDFNKLPLYDRLQLVTDFVSGMTDSYAITLHQQLIGVKLP